jgi:hypothetical protein
LMPSRMILWSSTSNTSNRIALHPSGASFFWRYRQRRPGYRSVLYHSAASGS